MCEDIMSEVWQWQRLVVVECVFRICILKQTRSLALQRVARPAPLQMHLYVCFLATFCAVMFSGFSFFKKWLVLLLADLLVVMLNEPSKEAKGTHVLPSILNIGDNQFRGQISIIYIL